MYFITPSFSVIEKGICFTHFSLFLHSSRKENTLDALLDLYSSRHTSNNTTFV